MYLLAVAAALANAFTTVMQRMGVERAPVADRLRFGLIAHAMRRAIWLAGVALMGLGFVLQAFALHAGDLSVVQPIVTLELPFLVIILGVWFRQHVGWHDWVGATAATGGLAVFLVAANPTGGDRQPSATDWVTLSVSLGAAVVATVLLAQIGSRAWRAAMYGAGAAITFALSAAFTKVMTTYIGRGLVPLLTHWQTYAIVVTGAVGLFLVQNAFHAGPVTASQTTLVVVDPLVSIGIGLGLFGDHVSSGAGSLIVESIGILGLFAGMYTLSRSPLVADMRTEDGGPPAGELLTRDQSLSGVERTSSKAPSTAPLEADDARKAPPGGIVS